MLTQAHSRRSTKSAPGLLRLDNRWIGRVHEHRAFHDPLPPPPIRPPSHEPTCRSAVPHHASSISPLWPATRAAAQKARRALVRRYGDALPETADVIVALGGDGLMLATLQRFMNSGKPIYGMHRGTVGFLMNEFSEQKLSSGWPPRRSR